ncbi:MAG: hypothetical protein ACI8QC_000340 [Planctomycetota bacterium]|jgi:hypothetical protein
MQAMWTCQLSSDSCPEGLATLADAFAKRNAGCSVDWLPGVSGVEASAGLRLAFVQGGEARGVCAQQSSALALGDVVLLAAGQALELDGPLDLLLFTVPGPTPEGVPAFLRPDHDPRLTDTPGGCAQEADAYRRILLTWSEDNGPYLCQALNAHRVRMHDSFSHYHPQSAGFEELYLVQHALPDARLYWSERVGDIENSAELTRETASALIQTLPLAAGQLVYLPRGTMHRAVGGALAQVITVPGFVPQQEIGLDHHLRKLQERFGFEGDEAIPFRLESSHGAVIQ